MSYVTCPALAKADSCQSLAVVCPAPDAEAIEMLLTIFFNKTGTSLPRKGRKTSGLSRSGCETAASQNADQNSHDSSATPSSPLCTLRALQRCQLTSTTHPLCHVVVHAVCTFFAACMQALNSRCMMLCLAAGGIMHLQGRLSLSGVTFHASGISFQAERGHLCGLQHVLYDALHVGPQPLRLQV